MLINKLNTDHTHLETTNYWTPLQNIEEEEEEEEEEDEEEDEEEEEEMNSIKIIQPIKINKKMNKWTRQFEQRKEWKLVIDSGATSKNELIEERNIKQGSIFAQQLKIESIIHNTITITTIIRESKRSRYLTGIKNSSRPCQ